MKPIFSMNHGIVGYVSAREGSTGIDVYDASFQYLTQLSDEAEASAYLRNRASKKAYKHPFLSR